MRDCDYCGKPFVPYSKRDRFCQDECCRAWHKENRDQREQARPKRYCFICQHCGKSYGTSHKERNKFCSRECAFAHKRQIAEQRASDRAEGIGALCELHSLQCSYCGRPFLGRHRGTEACSRECALARKRRRFQEYAQRRKGSPRHACQVCGKEFVVPYGNKRRAYCSDECANEAARRRKENPETKRKRSHMRRARKYGNGKVESISPHAVFERDEWTCGICGKKVDRSRRYPDPYSASLDHVVALASGGTHTWDNVQCAHLVCNSRKRDLPMSELEIAAFAF
jgi:hypothetical protein